MMTGGYRYGIMTTNVSEVFNKVLKGIRAMPVSGIVEYTFYKCNEYFVKRWDIAHKRKQLGKIWTYEADDHLDKQGEVSNSQVPILFDPTKYVYDVRSASRTNIGGERFMRLYTNTNLTTRQHELNNLVHNITNLINFKP